LPAVIGNDPVSFTVFDLLVVQVARKTLCLSRSGNSFSEKQPDEAVAGSR